MTGIPPEAITAAARALTPIGGGVPASRLWATEILEAAAPIIAAAERERIYDLLGHDHFVIFTEDRWTVEHSVECKLSGHMHECDWHTAVECLAADEPPASLLGRWRITGFDSEGSPDLVRADLNTELPGDQS